MVSFNAIRILATIPALASAAATGADANPNVHPSVHRTLRAQGTVNLIVTLKADTSSVLNSVQEADYSSKGDRIASLVSSLESHAEDTQTEVASVLAQESDSTTPLFSSTKSFWISNQVYIKDATVELLTKLLPLSTIAEIREEQVLPAPSIDAATTATNSTIGLLANEWGVTKINAPSVWDLGYNGKGIVVSSIDSGVLSTHTALKSNFRSSYGWYDPQSLRATPYDASGHGTHTMGTMVGSGGIGVAPGATWISCKGCRTKDCYEAELLSCAQFILCPTDTSGNNKDCSKAPDLVSNSWGGGQGDTFYDAAISAWRTAGIIPIFSIGNAGEKGCGTANSPGDNANVISVGATTSADALASYSSKGPSVNGLVKPEVSAPGSSVRSAWYTSTSAYNTIDGTSMACPHVSGTVALLLSAKPTLTYAQVKTAVTTTTSKTISSTGYTCGSTRDATIPNNQFGYGRLNALTAVQSVL